MNNIFIDFEKKLNVTQTQAGIILGIGKGNYSALRNEKIKITQSYLINSINAHMRLSKKEIKSIKKLRLGV